MTDDAMEEFIEDNIEKYYKPVEVQKKDSLNNDEIIDREDNIQTDFRFLVSSNFTIPKLFGN